MADDTVYVLLCDGFADWEPALALCELQRTDKYEVVTLGLSEDPVTSMGGLRITPDESLARCDLNRAAMLIVPGSKLWKDSTDDSLVRSFLQLYESSVPLAFICGATSFPVRMGLTHVARHTSNSIDYLRSMLPDYADEKNYVDELAVYDKNLITASGAGYVEFTLEILRHLNVYSDEELPLWYDLFKHGIIPDDVE